jgi:hypothetical protein
MLSMKPVCLALLPPTPTKVGGEASALSPKLNCPLSLVAGGVL